jgi:serine/threonine-protein kinase
MYERPLDELTPTRVSTTDSASNVFVSPNGEWLGFVDLSDRTVKKVARSGGPPLTIAALPQTTNPQGVTWGMDDTIVLGSSTAGAGLFRVSAGGGPLEPLTKPNADEGEGSHRLPQFLPGAPAVVFTIYPTDNQVDNARIALLDLRSGAWTTLIQGGTHPQYVQSGHLLFASQGAVRAVGFDLATLQVKGNPISVLEGVIRKNGGSTSFSVSANGTLTYIAGGFATNARTLVWVDRQGREEPIGAPPRAYAYPRLSPDGSRIALDVREDGNDIWVWDIARQTMVRLTFDRGNNRSPVWSPDGRRIAFTAARDGGEHLYWQAPDGSGVPELLAPGTITRIPTGFTPDGTQLLFSQETIPYDVGIIAVDGTRATKWLLNMSYDEHNAAVSPNGQWIAYQSNESGRDEVYVRPFPAVGSGRWQISTSGGTRPLWAHNGRELFYFIAPGILMSVPVRVDAGFSAGTPVRLFSGLYLSPQGGRTYDVSPDDRRFVMIKTEDRTAPRQQIVVVQNWFQELTRLVPVN